MFRNPQNTFRCLLACGTGLILFLQPGAAFAKSSYRVLYAFKGGSGDGANPYDTLVADKAGNLYGATSLGGTDGDGTVYRLAPDGTETVLYNFKGVTDGAEPDSEPSLLMDNKRNLYGTTFFGGDGGGCSCGTIFQLAPDGTEKVLYAFKGGSDGDYPFSGVIADAKHNLYGTTYNGGVNNEGTVFSLSPTGAETVLHSFGTGNDGQRPEDGLLATKSKFFGTAAFGGADGYGTFYKVGPDGSEKVLYSFTGGSDGQYPVGALIASASGKLYGTTYSGGAYGFGTVFSMTKDGTKTTLYDFAGGKDGANTYATLFEDKTGSLYGATVLGGGSGCGGYGCGTIFKLAPDGTETVVHTFKGGRDGAFPQEGLMTDGAGNLYGTTVNGGGSTSCSSGCGIVYTLKGGA